MGCPVSPRPRRWGALTLQRISAGAILPVRGPAILHGAVLIQDDGRIAQVGPDTEVARPASAATLQLPDAVVIPGLVNVHTHLELTALGGQLEDDDFFDWIQHLRRAKADLSMDDFGASAERGVRDAWRHGITTVADTGDSGAVVAALTRLGGRGVVYHEVFGPHPDQAEDAFAGLERAVDRLKQQAGDFVSVGVSPHAPYTVSATLYQRVADFAKQEILPMAVHIAESHAETELVTTFRGRLAESWRERGIPDLDTARSPIAYLDRLGVLEAHPLAIHVTQSDETDAALLARNGCSVALCPRSNHRHHHGVPPVRGLLAAGVAAGVGTDSHASVAALDLLLEVQQLRSIGGLTAVDALRMATLGGAEVLGMEQGIGSLEEGKWADICVLQFDDDPQPEQLVERVLQATAADVRHTYVAGRCVHDASGS